MIRFIYIPYGSGTKPQITLIKNEDMDKKHVIKGHPAFSLHSEIMTTPIEDRQILLDQRWGELTGEYDKLMAEEAEQFKDYLNMADTQGD